MITCKRVRLFQAAPQVVDLLADFGQDGDLDLLLFVNAEEEVVLSEGTGVDLEAQLPGVQAGMYVYDETADEGTLTLELDVPDPVGFVPTHVQLVGWSQDDVGSASDPTAFENRSFAIAVPGEVEVSALLDEPDLATEDVYHLELRAVRIAGGTIAEAGPAAVWAFATPTSDVAALESAYGSPAVLLRAFVIEDPGLPPVELTPAELDDRDLTPGTVKGSTIPPHDLPPDPFG